MLWALQYVIHEGTSHILQMINACGLVLQLTHTQTHPAEHACLRDLRKEIGLNLSCTGEQIKILVHFHQLSSSERYFCRARQEIRLLNYSFSQALCHSLLLSYSCSIKLTHWNHLSLPMLKTLSTKLYTLHCASTKDVSSFFPSPTLSCSHTVGVLQTVRMLCWIYM